MRLRESVEQEDRFPGPLFQNALTEPCGPDSPIGNLVHRKYRSRNGSLSGLLDPQRYEKIAAALVGEL